MTINRLIDTLFNSKMHVHETYYENGWRRGLIKAQYIQICQWDNISHWDQILGAAETLLSADRVDGYQEAVYEAIADCIYNVVGAIENPHDVTITISNNGSIVQLAVRYQYSWL